MAVQPSEITNISGWRLNKSEQKELDERVQKGEDKALVRKELQTKKAVACEERKRAAQAISAKPGSTGPRQKVSRKSAASSLPAAQSATAAATSGKDPTNAAYYASVEADIQTILQEFPGIELEMPLPLSQSESDRSKTGVQEPFNLTKAQNALGVHGVFRCSISLFWVQILASPTPGVPMSRRRVLDMAEFYYPNGKPAFMTGRMVELLADKAALSDKPQNLQMLSPEELVHSLVASCAHAVRRLGRLLYVIAYKIK